MGGSDAIVDRGLSLADLADGEKVAAERPSHRLFRAHPAIGLQQTEEDFVSGPSTVELGVRWFALPAEERRQREADLARGLLRIAARHDSARFEAGWTPDADERHAELAHACGAVVTADVTVRGSLTPRAIEALVERRPDMLIVDAGPELTARTAWGLAALGVWIDPWKRDELQRELEEAWWIPARERAEREAERTPPEIARRRAAERELRARVYVGWQRAQRVLAPLLIAVSLWTTRSDEWLDLIRAGASALALMWTLDWLVERWYHREGRPWRARPRLRRRMRAGGP